MIWQLGHTDTPCLETLAQLAQLDVTCANTLAQPGPIFTVGPVGPRVGNTPSVGLTVPRPASRRRVESCTGLVSKPSMEGEGLTTTTSATAQCD
jgi:hypothetical protein